MPNIIEVELSDIEEEDLQVQRVTNPIFDTQPHKKQRKPRKAKKSLDIDFDNEVKIELDKSQKEINNLTENNNNNNNNNDDERTKRSLIWQITQYGTHFKNRLKEGCYTLPKNLDKKNSEELEKIKDEIHAVIGLKSDLTNSIIKPVFLLGSGVLEEMLPELGINCQGLSGALNNNPKIEETLRELAIELNWSTYIPPQYRLGMIMVSTIYGLHRINTQRIDQKNNLEQGLDKKVADNKKEEFKDL